MKQRSLWEKQLLGLEDACVCGQLGLLVNCLPLRRFSVFQQFLRDLFGFHIVKLNKL